MKNILSIILYLFRFYSAGYIKKCTIDFDGNTWIEPKSSAL